MNETERLAYREKMEAKLDTMKSDIRRLEAQLRESKADMRLKAEEQLSHLRKGADEAAERLEALKTASGAAWGEARDKAAAAWDRLESTFREATSRLRER